MNSVVEDIKDMLLAESAKVGGTLFGMFTLGDTLHLYREPALPDNTISVFETPGMPPVGLLSSNTDTKHYERPAIQIRIRNRQPEAGFELAYKILQALNTQSQKEWGDYLYSAITTMSNPSMIDWDTHSRVRIVLNLNIQRRLK